MKFLFLLVSLNTLAGITTNVVHLEMDAEDKVMEAFVTYNGRVFAVDPKNTNVVNSLKEAIKNNSEVELDVELDEKSKDLELIKSVKLLDAEPEVGLSEEVLHPMSNYTPSNINTYEDAMNIFKSLNPKTKMFSQCFNRAHIWAKQMYDDFSVDSMKILIYYTKKFRKEINKKWWFHIAPMVSVNGQYYVMDREFTRKPVTDKEWEKIFIRKLRGTGYRCKKILNIKEYYAKGNYENEYCNIQHTSMYYWEPNDMSRLDKKGLEKRDWVNWELRAAAKEGFKKWRKVYKKYKVQ